MGRNKKTIALAIVMGSLVIASALIWGFVISGTFNALEGTECYDKIQNSLVGGALMQIIIILIGGMFPLIIIKKTEKKEE